MFLNRREILKHMAFGASTLALTPLMSQLRAQETTGRLPKRFVFVVKSSGFYPEDITPEGIPFEASGKKKVKLKGLKLSPCLQEFNQHLSHTSVVRGLSNKVAGGAHHGFYGALGCYKTPGGTTSTDMLPDDITIDCLLGSHMPSIYNNLGFFPRAGINLVTPAYISALRPRLQLPFFDASELTYKNLFGAILSGEDRKEFELKGHLLDNMIRDVKKFSRELNGQEKEKMEHYLSNFESIKARDAKIFAQKDVLKKHVPEMDERYGKKERNLDLHFEMAAVALITGMTNVTTIRTCDISTGYENIGLVGAKVHGIGHGKAAGQESAQVARTMIRQYHCRLMARMADKLKAIPEGDGTMLDNTLIVYLSDGGDAHHGGTKEVVRVMVGGKNIIKNNGHYIQYPAYMQKGHFTTQNLYLTLLNGIGRPQKRFGNVDSGLNGITDHSALLDDFVN